MTTDTPVNVEVSSNNAAAPVKPAVVVESMTTTTTTTTVVSAVVPAADAETAEVEVAEKEPSEEELKALEGLDELKQQGARAFATENFAEAVEKFSLVAELLGKAYGSLSPKCADALLLYGRALYRHAVAQSTPLGDKESTEEENAAETSAESVAGAAAIADKKEKSGRFVFEGEPESAEEKGEDNAEDEEQEVDEEGDAEDKDDLEVAWEVLDTARIIFSKMDSEEARRQLAETYMVLGEVSLESENFSQAVTDFTSCSEMLVKLLPDTDRQIAHVHYRLANALEFASNSAKATEEVQNAINVLKRRIEMLKAKGGDDAEVKELEELIPEMERKIEDLKSTPSQPEAAANVDQLLDQTLGSKPATVNDLTNLVKPKKQIDPYKFVADKLAQSNKRKADVIAEPEEVKKAKEAEA